MSTKKRLAKELRIVAEKVGPHRASIYRSLADRAETGEFDDYADVHVCGPTALYNILKSKGMDKFAARVANGEFDASFEESEEWARSQTDPEIVAMMGTLGIGPDRSRNQ